MGAIVPRLPRCVCRWLTPPSTETDSTLLALSLRYAIGRLLIAIPMLVLITFGSFVLLFSVGSPAVAIAGDGATVEQIMQIRAEQGFDRPIVVQYWDWLQNILQGDLGTSMQHRGSVAHLMGDYLPPTLFLAAMAMGMATVAALIMGSIVGLRRNGWIDKGMQGVSLLGIAIPNFLLGLGLILVFAIWWPLFPAGGYRSPEQVGFLGTLHYMLLPAVALAAALMCVQTRTFRASLIKQYGADYVRTARMKGVSKFRIFSRHVARNAAAPLATVIGLEVGVLITGAVLVEVVFAVPGMGTLLITSVRGQDFPVVQALVAIFGAVVLFANLAADLVALWLNPESRRKA